MLTANIEADIKTSAF